jgi:hypothetical protein
MPGAILAIEGAHIQSRCVTEKYSLEVCVYISVLAVGV